MGIFRDLKRLNDQGKRIREEHPIRDQIADASAKLGAATAMMQQMAASREAAHRVLTHGVDATAMITGARQQPTLFDHNPLVELDLLVTMPNGVPIPVTRTEVVTLLHLTKAQVGSKLAVRVDPTDPGAIWIDWAAPPKG